jgi:hypothetical protein
MQSAAQHVVDLVTVCACAKCAGCSPFAHVSLAVTNDGGLVESAVLSAPSIVSHGLQPSLRAVARRKPVPCWPAVQRTCCYAVWVVEGSCTCSAQIQLV